MLWSRGTTKVAHPQSVHLVHCHVALGEDRPITLKLGQMQSIKAVFVPQPPPTFDGLLCSKLIVERERERVVVLRLRNPKSIAS